MKIKKIVTIIISLVMIISALFITNAFVASAEDKLIVDKTGKYAYRLDNNKSTVGLETIFLDAIEDELDKTGTLVLPDTVDGHKVTSYGGEAGLLYTEDGSNKIQDKIKYIVAVNNYLTISKGVKRILS